MPERVISPGPELVLSIVVPARVMAPPIERSPLVVEIVPLRLTEPPVCWKIPLLSIAPPARFKAPANMMSPPPVVSALPLISIVDVVREMLPVVCKSDWRVAVPGLDPVSVKELEFMVELILRSVAFSIKIAPRGEIPPTGPLNVTELSQASMVKVERGEALSESRD